MRLDGQKVSHDFVPSKSLVILLNLFIKNGKFVKNISLTQIYNKVNKTSETSLDGKQEKSARGYVRELNKVFPDDFPDFLVVNNKIVNPDQSHYFLE